MLGCEKEKMNGARKFSQLSLEKQHIWLLCLHFLMYKKKENILTLVIDKMYKKNIVLKAIYQNKQVHVTQYIQFLVAMKS